jgi:uncharacterized protein YbaP (TraB family)/NADH:ubiquinone oxidoreductase subunit
MYHTTIKNTLLCCLIGLSINLFAQDKTVDKKNYALLWEITGKDLAKPSYLFGTMHLRDKRVFAFSDSVLLKMEGCEAFASEIRMDSAVYQSWELAISGDTTNRLSKKLSKTGYERLLQALKSKGINLDSLESKNTALVHGWLSDKEDTDEQDDSKDLFLDLYLTRLAYNQGKSLHGLERMEDYEDLNDSFFQQFEDSTFSKQDTAFTSIFAHFAMLEEMINVYNQGDLDQLLSIVKDTKAYNGSQYKREILDNRNVRMLQKLEDIMRQKSVFCAVGAAHLPDSMGLIALLREKGYTVRKVTPQFTGLAEQFKPKTIERSWYHHTDEFNHVEMDFPEQPYLMNKLNANQRRLGIQNIYFDITTGAIMMSESDFYPHIGQKKQTKDQLLTDLFTRWIKSRGFKSIQKEKIKQGTYEGYQFSARLKSKALIKGQYFLENNNTYKTMVFFDKHNETNTERADKFLNSLKINPLPLTDWQVFEEEKGAFNIKMPVKPDFQEIKSAATNEEGESSNYFANLFVSKEAKEGFTYMLRYHDMPRGQYIENDSLYMTLVMAESLERFRKMKSKIEVDSVTRHYGCPEYSMKVSFDGVTMHLRNILRGSRMYFLLGQPPLEKNKVNNKKLEDWMNSFRFSPFLQPKLTKKDLPEIGLSLGLPTANEPYILKEEKSRFPSKSEKTIHTTDNQIGAAYVVTRTEFSKYYSATNPDSFWNKYARNLKNGESKKVKIEMRDTIFKGIKAKLVSLDYKQTQNTFKSIVFLKDGYQYEISVVLPSEIATDAYANTYFEAIDFIGKQEKQDIFSSKKQLIVNDLASPFDSIRTDARTALRMADWTKDDLPILTNALQKKYPDDTLKYASVRLSLLNEITQFKDSAILTVLENLVRTTDKDTFLRDAILCAFLELDTLESANRFFTIAQSLGKIDFSEFYCLTNFMTDSVARASLYYDKMLSLSDKPFENQDIISISERLASLDTLHLLRPLFVRYTPQYLATANALLLKNADMLKNDTVTDLYHGDYYTLSNYIDLFKYIPNTPEINQFLRKIATTNQLFLLSDAIQALAKNGQPIENSAWQRMLKSKSNWYGLLSSLKYDSLLSIVPPQYINQKDIAEGIMYNYLIDEYGEPKTMTLLETQKYKSETLYIFKCFMDYGEGENNYIIAICSQPMDKTKYNLDADLQLISDSLPDVKNYKKVVAERLKDFEKDK